MLCTPTPALHPLLTGGKAAWAGTQCTSLEVKECGLVDLRVWAMRPLSLLFPSTCYQ